MACTFSAQLHSKVDLSRKVSAEAFFSLAERCEKPEAIEALLKHTFGVLGGSSSCQVICVCSAY